MLGSGTGMVILCHDDRLLSAGVAIHHLHRSPLATAATIVADGPVLPWRYPIG
jgi:hypothetical protein